MLPYPLDVPALGDGARQTQTDHVQEQARDPEQVHGVSDKRRGDDVVHEEGPVVGEEHAPGENATDGRTDRQSVQGERSTHTLKVAYRRFVSIPQGEEVLIKHGPNGF